MESPELDIKRYAQLILKKKHIFVLVAVLVITTVALYSYWLPKVYEAKCTVIVVRNVLDSYIKGIAATSSLDERVSTLSYALKSRNILLKVIQNLDLDVSGKKQTDIEGLIDHFQGKTTVTLQANKLNNRIMDLFVVSYRDANPALARDYVNTLVKIYIEENQSEKKGEASAANRFVADQIRFFKNKADKIDEEIANLSKGADISFVVGDAKIHERLIELQKRLNELTATYTENYPETAAVRAEIKSLQEKLKNQSDGGPEENGPNTGQRKNIYRERKKLADLQREQETYKKIYEDMVSTLGKSEVSKQAEAQDKAGTFKIEEPALLPTKPVGQDRVQILLLGLLAGVAGGGGVVILLDAIDNSVKSVSMLKGLSLPVLALIPKIQTDKERLRKRKKDIIFYALTALYLACFLGVFTVEFMGLPYMDDFLHQSFTSIKDTIRNTF